MGWDESAKIVLSETNGASMYGTHEQEADDVNMQLDIVLSKIVGVC